MPCLWALLVNKPGPAAAWWEHTIHSEVTLREGLWTARDLSIACSIVDATYVHAIKGRTLYVSGFVFYQ